MASAIRSEIRKLTTTRSSYLLILAVAVMSLMSVVDPEHDASTFERSFDEQTFVFFTSLMTRVLILVLGIRIVTDEFRHGTILPTLLVTPSRPRVVAAKAVTASAAGAGLAAIAWSTMVVSAAVVAATEDAHLVVGAQGWATLGGMALAGAGWAVIGVGLGAVLRSQVAAIVGGLVWLMALEDAVAARLGEVGEHLPGQSGLALALAPNAEVALTAAASMAAWAAVMLLAGAAMMRRDVA